MVDHPEQMKLLLATATSLNGEFYPNAKRVSEVNATLTKFVVVPIFGDRPPSNTVQYSEKYNIEYQASSLANLEIAQEKFFAAQTGATSGYTQSTAAYPYWIGNMSVKDKEFDKNIFRGIIEVEARWNF